MKRRKSNKNRLDRYPRELRGPPQNRFGGFQMQIERGLKGGTFGAASECRSFSREEVQAWVEEHGITC